MSNRILTTSGSFAGRRNPGSVKTPVIGGLITSIVTPSWTWNSADKDANITLSANALIASGGVSAANHGVRGNKSINGKQCWFLTAAFVGNGDETTGICNATTSIAGTITGGSFAAARSTVAPGWNFAQSTSGSFLATGTVTPLNMASVFMYAFDSATGKYWVGLDGTWVNSGNPTAGTGNIITGFSSGPYFPVFWTAYNALNNPFVAVTGPPVASWIPSGFTLL